MPRELNDDDYDDKVEEVTSASMRRLAFEKIADDYYLGSSGGMHNACHLDSDDEISSDDEVKSTLRKLAGETKKIEKDAFGRRRRRSEFEDEMDDELDRSIGEYASEHLGAKISKVEDVTDKVAEQEHEMSKVIEEQMKSLELLPYEVELTDSEVDPEMPAAVMKNKNGEPVKLIYSCKRGDDFDIDERRRKQKERRMRVAASRQPEKAKRNDIIKNVMETFQAGSSEKTPLKKKYEESTGAKKPLSSILKKKEKVVEESQKNDDDDDEKMELEDDEEDAENPIKKSLRDRQKEIEKNDELLYDDEEDEENEKWVKSRRRENRGDDVPDIGQVDGVLSCPGCMSELTRDCQRHEIYKTQYRAMFVSNCRLEPEKMAVKKTNKELKQERKKMRKAGAGTEGLESNKMYTPVKCAVCATLVAMMDDDEVYHFFNVLSGYS